MRQMTEDNPAQRGEAGQSWGQYVFIKSFLNKEHIVRVGINQKWLGVGGCMIILSDVTIYKGNQEGS